MGGSARILFGVIVLASLGAPVASGASFDCRARPLTLTQSAICDDAQLSRMDEHLARRIDGLATRLNFGQYLGLRHWQAEWALQRGECDSDRDCIAANLRAQARLLDRLQRCVASSIARRGCLRDMIAGEQESMRR
jgi:uncharacterized protein